MASRVPVVQSAASRRRPQRRSGSVGVGDAPARCAPATRSASCPVHAHPDDEASKGAGTVARYAAEGIRAALVCCTGGEEGEILNPAADTPEVRADLGAVRMAELRASVDAIGYAELLPARLPRLGHARHRGQRARPTTSPTRRSTKRSGGWCAIIRARAAAGDRHLRRRAGVLPAPRPHPGARDLGAGVRRRRRSRPVSRRRPAVAAVEALLLGLLVPADPGAARRVPAASARRAPTPSASRVRGAVGSTELADHATDHARRRGRLPATPRRAGAARAPHADRSRRATGCGCPTTCCAETFPWEEFVLARSLVPGCRCRRRRARARPVRRACATDERRDQSRCR